MSTPDLITYPDKDLLVMGLADRLSADLKSALLTHEHVSFAVAGGTSPGPVFKLLVVWFNFPCGDRTLFCLLSNFYSFV